ncbi:MULTISPECIES: metallophosphoesterase family protein [unclassified Nocardioides]|uniref:metallophosphoesterase family protein n=1 Tax=unclassified Nocardioides TaxID=2615069 RepID=UPI0013FDC3BD|nr:MULTISPECIES: metallophosphoesterase [unclassified Nocardioides]
MLTLMLFGAVGACTPSGEPTTDHASGPALSLEQEPTTRLAVARDTGTGTGSAIEATVEEMVAQNAIYSYDALVLLGDLIYPEGDAEQVPTRISGVFDALTQRGARLLPVLGNHDYMSDEQAQIMHRLGRSTSWYTETVGIVRVVVLDTEQVDDPDQLAWLDETLATPTDAPWTIVAMHKPAYSAGYHGSDESIQEEWVPLFERYAVPLVLAGHDHDYQRSKKINGVTYVVSGGAATLRPTGRRDFTAVSASIRHFLDLVVSPTRLTGRAIDQNGNLIDSFDLRR